MKNDYILIEDNVVYSFNLDLLFDFGNFFVVNFITIYSNISDYNSNRILVHNCQVYFIKIFNKLSFNQVEGLIQDVNITAVLVFIYSSNFHLIKVCKKIVVNSLMGIFCLVNFFYYSFYHSSFVIFVKQNKSQLREKMIFRILIRKKILRFYSRKVIKNKISIKRED